MNPWLEGGVLTLALLLGVGLGWLIGKQLGLRMPNAAVATAVLAAGSLGGPALTTQFMGREIAAYLVALLIAGLAAGLTFWPMGERQGEKEWL